MDTEYKFGLKSIVAPHRSWEVLSVAGTTTDGTSFPPNIVRQLGVASNYGGATTVLLGARWAHSPMDEIPPRGFGISVSSAYAIATSRVFQSPWCMTCQMGTPRRKARRTKPLRKEWPVSRGCEPTMRWIISRNRECESVARVVVDSAHNGVWDD